MADADRTVGPTEDADSALGPAEFVVVNGRIRLRLPAHKALTAEDERLLHYATSEPLEGTENVSTKKPLVDRLVVEMESEDTAEAYNASLDESLQQIDKTLAAMRRDQADIDDLKGETRAILRTLRAA